MDYQSWSNTWIPCLLPQGKFHRARCKRDVNVHRVRLPQDQFACLMASYGFAHEMPPIESYTKVDYMAFLTWMKALWDSLLMRWSSCKGLCTTNGWRVTGSTPKSWVMQVSFLMQILVWSMHLHSAIQILIGQILQRFVRLCHNVCIRKTFNGQAIIDFPPLIDIEPSLRWAAYFQIKGKQRRDRIAMCAGAW